MNIYTPLWLGLALAGFVVGLWVRPMVLLRIAIALFLLAGLGLMVANLLGSDGLAYTFGAGMAGIALVFAVAIVGAIAAWMVRRALHVQAPRERIREYNSII
jgi:hypothetical protein